MTWYDNEFGYASRLYDLARLVASKIYLVSRVND
jgi:glyceraldehyde-3-phosphate dehydrogenase/erythrose-4-phosphate dehydrogenase